MIDISKIKDIVNQTKYSKEDLQEISIIYTEVTALSGKARALNIGCSSCVGTAIKIIKNYLNFYHVEPKEKATITKINVQVDDLNDLTYKELLEQAKNKGIDIPRNISKVKLIDLLK